ncbi:MAG: hypothetical protein HY738_13965 [Bacteroidia bacterium]|nr:hypothetical protein [Bacteroidia bacterium]
MNPNKFQNKYRIQSTRMPGWDYSRGGKYYVTICTKNHDCYFGNVIDGKMRLNEMGIITDEFWREIPKHFPHTWLDEYVVMPNHVHGIVVMKRLTITKHNDDPHIGNAVDVGNVDAQIGRLLRPKRHKCPKCTVQSQRIEKTFYQTKN